MANLSYCRWENTSNDMRDCLNAMAEVEVENLKEWFEELNEYEQSGFRNFMHLADQFVSEIIPECESAGIDI